jgi:hypothetical protein
MSRFSKYIIRKYSIICCTVLSTVDYKLSAISRYMDIYVDFLVPVFAVQVANYDVFIAGANS